jgi:polyisoprenoid-binding protein YceI
MAPCTVLAMLVLTAAPSEETRLQVLPEAEGLHVHVKKRGLFSAFAHDHDFEVTRWEGTAQLPDGDPARASVALVLRADSLRDREKGLSDDDRKKVEAQTAGPAILDAAHAPEITFRADGAVVEAVSTGAAEGAVRGTLKGKLTLRGKTRPLDAAFQAWRKADGWVARGSARFRQSEFGITPFSGVGGTVGVKDEVEVTFALALRPRKGP